MGSSPNVSMTAFNPTFWPFLPRLRVFTPSMRRKNARSRRIFATRWLLNKVRLRASNWVFVDSGHYIIAVALLPVDVLSRYLDRRNRTLGLVLGLEDVVRVVQLLDVLGSHQIHHRVGVKVFGVHVRDLCLLHQQLLAGFSALDRVLEVLLRALVLLRVEDTGLGHASATAGGDSGHQPAVCVLVVLGLTGRGTGQSSGQDPAEYL